MGHRVLFLGQSSWHATVNRWFRKTTGHKRAIGFTARCVTWADFSRKSGVMVTLHLWALDFAFMLVEWPTPAKVYEEGILCLREVLERDRGTKIRIVEQEGDDD